MEDQEHQQQQQEGTRNRQNQSSESREDQRNESVRSRWTPKPEQILILESIFNSGMVNPPKDETVRIRKLLEKFGSVGDANVFYWFQNRRSRSRRRQRQIQASLCAAAAAASSENQKLVHHQTRNNINNIQEDSATSSSAATGFLHQYSMSTSYPFVVGSSSSSSFAASDSSAAACGINQQNDFADELLGFPGQIGHLETDQQTSSNINHHHFHYQSGFITVFINGVATEVPRGLTDTMAMFGQDFVLLHSTGIPVSVNEYGFLLEGLHPGESYFLVHRPA
ncbi:OLC1v1036202C1 [Oldenlandia corymbosa var. corymbosa]|uniref:Protein WUSCHEL n=1 Tax=Oldenlandia corymbosa var. corymbosa TaxID=529605 RepID=A0AAV1CXY6_OLDCO|nr:OLC1v1036202C1 [Oldenlandia corymbosa var. corymbosa]